MAPTPGERQPVSSNPIPLTHAWVDGRMTADQEMRGILSLEAGLAGVKAWEAEHGESSAEELAWADSILDRFAGGRVYVDRKDLFRLSEALDVELDIEVV